MRSRGGSSKWGFFERGDVTRQFAANRLEVKERYRRKSSRIKEIEGARRRYVNKYAADQYDTRQVDNV